MFSKRYICTACRRALPASAYARWGTVGGFVQWVHGARGTCDECRDAITQFPAFKPVPTMLVEMPVRPWEAVRAEAGEDHDDRHVDAPDRRTVVIGADAPGLAPTAPAPTMQEVPSVPTVPWLPWALAAKVRNGNGHSGRA